MTTRRSIQVSQRTRHPNPRLVVCVVMLVSQSMWIPYRRHPHLILQSHQSRWCTFAYLWGYWGYCCSAVVDISSIGHFKGLLCSPQTLPLRFVTHTTIMPSCCRYVVLARQSTLCRLLYLLSVILSHLHFIRTVYATEHSLLPYYYIFIRWYILCQQTTKPPASKCPY